MARISAWLVVFLLSACLRALAIEDIATGTATPTYNTAAPTSSEIANWQTGWTQPTVQPSGTTYTTGWNYVGTVAGGRSNGSGVYLGNGWVMTCAHVDYGNFTLNGTTYPVSTGTVHDFSTTSTGSTTQFDFEVFQVYPAPDLPALPLRTTDPVVNSSRVVMIGYGEVGNETHETWGDDLLNYGINEPTTLNFWLTNDFWVVNESSAEYEVIDGDSGGADFIYNSTAQRWELAGLNEAGLDNKSGVQIGSAFVQLDTYASQIEAVIAPPQPVDEPTMSQWNLIIMGGLLLSTAVSGKVPARR